MTPRGTRAGFTLVEVMVALVVMGVVLVGARTMLGQIAGDADRITAASAEADREANADLLLRTAAGRLEVVPVPGQEIRFEGEPRGARFHTWCEVPDGWLERCEASLGFIELEGENALALRLSTGEMVALRRGFQSGEMTYLRDAASGGSWVRRWGASITAPIAFGIVIDGDTSIIRIGERG
ncbi:prepilin-type N-terminal cleavage/methylation domain-containing protein [Longimicrobium sp.]|uniref:prepilin-type N-terminal cleavage/methylation domain-containing protein n=1 Tax=Longimicrobium sp. TaxID=2029185 RepID=UPI002E2F7D33|nr:prepilin-type N-terminal cleavage/methylation domain-containing protein [Longimicrobium sp.]HEX6041738.1 prepilin-type N-terminal cleavage/methylation domain-containing protein [Longimicrobium sp.]